MNAFEAGGEHKFAFGLRPVAGRTATELSAAAVEPWEFIYQLGDVGAWGVALHDDDLAPWGSSSADRDDILDKVAKALDSTGMAVTMARTNITGHHVFDHGAFTSVDRDVRRYAIQKAMRAIDLGAELGAQLHDLPAEGVDSRAVRAPLDALDRYREAIDFLCGYVGDQGYPTRFALPSTPHVRQGEPLIATAGCALAFINTLARPEIVGLNSELVHGADTGVHHGVAQVIAAGKLFHVDLDAHAGREQDPSFGSTHVSDAFFLVKLLEETGYDGPLHFDVDARHLDEPNGIWDFAVGCMRTYRALAAKAKRFADDPEIRDALAECGAIELSEPSVGPFSAEAGRALSGERFDPPAMTRRRPPGHRLDQLVTDLVLGLR